MIPDFAPASAQTSLPLYICADGQLPDLTPAQTAWASAQGFTGAAGQLCVLPAEDGRPAGALFGRDPSRMSIARAAAALPEGDWALSEGTEEDALAWRLAGYRYDRYDDGYDKGRFACVTRYGRVDDLVLSGLRG